MITRLRLRFMASTLRLTAVEFPTHRKAFMNKQSKKWRATEIQSLFFVLYIYINQ